jgi:hypothetical protein
LIYVKKSLEVIPCYSYVPVLTRFAGWSSPVARQAHNLKVTGSNPVPATNFFLFQPFLGLKPPDSQEFSHRIAISSKSWAHPGALWSKTV